MPFKTFTPAVLTSADMNTYLMQQSVIICTSGTRPGSPINGMTIYETDTECYVTYSGSAWIYRTGGVWANYTPTLTNITLGNGTIAGRYTIIGKTIKGSILLLAGSTTTYPGGNIGFSIPVSARNVTNLNLMPVGSAYVDNGTGATRRLATPGIQSLTRLDLFYEGGTVTNTAPMTLGTATRVAIEFSYEAA